MYPNEEHQEALINQFAEFTREKIRPFANQFDEREMLPESLISELGDHSFLGASFPKSFGGLALDPWYIGQLTEIVGKACCSTRALFTVHGGLVGQAILKFGTEKQKEEWLPKMAKAEKIGAFALSEPLVGSDAKNVTTQYREKGNSYVINGHKKWISFAEIADFFIIIATNENGKVSAFIVDKATPGITIKPIKGLMANRASHIGEILLCNVSIPKENLLGFEGGGFSYVVNHALHEGRFSVAWGGLAVAQEALDAMVTYARNRNQFGTKIYNFQLIKKMVAEATVNITSARLMCEKAALLKLKKGKDEIIVTNMAKYVTSKVAVSVTADALQVHGGNGFSKDFPVARLFREAKIFEVIEGSSQIHEEIIANYGLKKFYQFPSNKLARNPETNPVLASV